MTMHYGETVTAEEIVKGWEYHGYGMPMAFATITPGDALAYNCWIYMSHLQRKTEDMPTPEEFFEKAPPEIKEELVQTLKEVVSLYKNLEEPEDKKPWPLNQE